MKRENNFESNDIEEQSIYFNVSCQHTKWNVKLKKLTYGTFVKELQRIFHPPCFLFFLILGLVVAVIDHEHFRMKLMYKQKKQIAADLKTAKNNFKDLQVNIKSPFYHKNHIKLEKRGFFFKVLFFKIYCDGNIFPRKIFRSLNRKKWNDKDGMIK